MSRPSRRPSFTRALLLVTLGAVGGVLWGRVRPAADREWVPEQERIVSASTQGDLLTIRDVRNADHCADSDTSVVRWEDRTYDLRQLDSLWFVLSPFDRDWRGPAHPFLSFGFGDTSFVAVSVEARKEVGESYSIWKGIAKRYEMMYVVADERDLIGLRVGCYEDDVYLYPVRTPPERARSLLTDMLKRAERLGERPEFYHTVWNNCTTNVVEHANRVSTRRIPGGWRVLFPGFTDEIAHRLGLLDADGDIDTLRRRHLINERAARALQLPPGEFSAALRSPLDPSTGQTSTLESSTMSP